MNKPKTLKEKMLTLEEAKKEKIQKALDKGYSANPSYHSFPFLLFRLRQELLEFEEALYYKGAHYENVEATYELADCMNVLDFIVDKWKREVTNETKRFK